MYAVLVEGLDPTQREKFDEMIEAGGGDAYVARDEAENRKRFAQRYGEGVRTG